MNFLNPKKLEDLVASLLLKGRQNTTDLLDMVRKVRRQTTKQGFYVALRKLKKEDVITVYRKEASLNTTWLAKMRDVVNEVTEAHTTGNKSFGVLKLEDGESVTYSFSNIKNLDTFWGHSQNILVHNTPNAEPLYTYDPHYWFYIARKETEKKLLEEIVENKRQFLITVGGNTDLDKIIKTDFNSDYLQYNMEEVFPKRNYYVTIIGDYISEVLLDEPTAKKIDYIYKNKNVIDSEVTALFNEILNSKTKNKIKISRNKNKAEKLKRKLRKNFYLLRSV